MIYMPNNTNIQFWKLFIFLVHKIRLKNYFLRLLLCLNFGLFFLRLILL